MSLMAPVSWGELIDKFTILEIKSERIQDPAKRANIRRELEALQALRDQAHQAHAGVEQWEVDLKAVNRTLWDIEDAIRECERRREFGPQFIELARAVYHENDRRSLIKREINLLLGSGFVEEKSYRPY